MTARKSTTPPAKRPTRPVRKNVDVFDRLRKRADAAGSVVTNEDAEPYVIDAFDPPVVVEWPAKLIALDDLDMAYRNDDYTGMLRILLGEDYRRVLEKFDEYPDALLLLSGLALEIIEHFVGSGVNDVPGGSAAS